MNTFISYNSETGEYDLISLEDGEVISSSGLKDTVSRYVFNVELAILMCQEIRRGRTISEIGLDPRFPPTEVIAHWRRMHPMFEDAIKIARKDRAEGYHDKIMQMADALGTKGSIYTKEELAAAKLAMDAYRWGAEKGDPETFGKKQEITHQNTQPTQIVVHTGIIRSKPDVVVENTKLEEQ